MDILREITLRDIPLTPEVKVSKRTLVEWLCLSLGLLSPREKRKGVVAVMEVLLEAHKEDARLSFPEIVERVKGKMEVDEKTIYYHLKRLKALGILTKRDGRYFLGDGSERALSKIFSKVIEEHCKKVGEKIKEGLRAFQFS